MSKWIKPYSEPQMSRNLFLETLFRSGESVCSGGLYAVDVGAQQESQGPFISINPLNNRRADANVTSFRNFLVEMDGESSLEKQFDIVTKCGLPYSTCVWSGGKSLHFVVAMQESVDEATWRKLAKALVKSVPGADPTTTNPSRFTRLAEARRDNGEYQTLIKILGRPSARAVEEYAAPHVVADTPNFHSLYRDMMGLEGVEAAHPLTKAFIAGTHPCYGGRNIALYKCAADLKDVGIEADEATDLLAGPAEALGLDRREIITTIRSAYRRRK